MNATGIERPPGPWQDVVAQVKGRRVRAEGPQGSRGSHRATAPAGPADPVAGSRRRRHTGSPTARARPGPWRPATPAATRPERGLGGPTGEPERGRIRFDRRAVGGPSSSRRRDAGGGTGWRRRHRRPRLARPAPSPRRWRGGSAGSGSLPRRPSAVSRSIVSDPTRMRDAATPYRRIRLRAQPSDGGAIGGRAAGVRAGPRCRFEFVEPFQRRLHVLERRRVVERPGCPWRDLRAIQQPIEGSTSASIAPRERASRAADLGCRFASRPCHEQVAERRRQVGECQFASLAMPWGAIAGGYAARCAACHHASMEIHFLGGATTVTGSQHLLITARARVLIDCGMFQGSPNESIRNRIPFDYEPSELDAVLLTHAHLDHCGLLPLLGREGYTGPIHATAGTVELATVVLLDSGHLHEEFAKRDARWEKRHPELVAADDRKHSRCLPGCAGPGRGWRGRRHRRVDRARRARPDDDRTGPRNPAPPTHGRAIPRPSCAPSPRTWISISMRRCTRSRTLKRSSPSSQPIEYGEESRSRAGRACHVPGCRPHPGVRDHPGPGRGTGRRARARDRLFRRCGPARHADPARSDRHDRGRLRPGGIHVRRPRARAGRRSDPDHGRDGPDGGGGGRGAARAVVRHRADTGGGLGAGPAHHARRDPAAAALPRLTDGVQGVRHLPPPPGLLRRGDGEAPARGRVAARLPEPDHRARLQGVAGDRQGAAAVHDRRLATGC